MSFINTQIIVMRIKLFLVLITLIPLMSLNAQRLGIRAGANLSTPKVELDGMDTKSYTGFNIGVISDFSLPLSGLKINTGLLFFNQGFTLKNDMGNNTGITYNFRTNHLEIPVNIRKEFNLLLVKPYIQAGLYSSYAISGRVKDGEGSESMEFKSGSDRLTTGMSFGVGSYIIDKIQVLISYDYGFTKSEIKLGEANIATKNRRWALSAAYMF